MHEFKSGGGECCLPRRVFRRDDLHLFPLPLSLYIPTSLIVRSIRPTGKKKKIRVQTGEHFLLYLIIVARNDAESLDALLNYH